MQRHLLEAEAALAHRPDQRRREVQPRRRRRHRPLEPRIDRLIARIVDLLAFAVQIGRNGDPAQVLQQLPERQVGRPFEPHLLLPAALAQPPGPQMPRASGMFERDLHGAFLPFLEVAHDARPHRGALHGEGPLVVGRIARLEAEDLDARTRRFVHDDPRPDHLRVVEHQQLPRRQHVAQVGEAPFGDRASAVDQQLRCAPLRERELRDPPVGQVVVVVVYVDMSLRHRTQR